MTLALDHIVIAVADLDEAAADYRALGFTVIVGGDHADGASGNVLVVLADGSYLELIAFHRPRPDNRWSDVLARAGEGLVDHALLPSDIRAAVAAAAGRGLDLVGPSAGGRNRPDGARLEWETARTPRADVPFLCADVTPRRLRVQDGDVRRHANGATGVAALTVAVRDLRASADRYAALLGARPGPIRILAGFDARACAFDLGSTTIMLAAPIGADGPLAEALAARGEGPFAVAFRGPADAGPLDPARTHGARLSIVAA